ncbi:MAG TPA: hypothetical protein VIF62_19965 [Labilithrix sp.]
MSPAALQSSSKGTSALVWVVIVGGVLAVFLVAGIALMVVILAKRTPDAAPVAAGGTDNGPNLETKPDDAGSVATKATATVATTTTARVSPTIPTIGTTATKAPPFSRSRAVSAVDNVAAGAQSCHVTGDPTGVGSIRVDFEPNGNVATLTRKPFAFTTTGECVSARMRAIRLGAFDGKANESVEATFVIRAPAPPPSSSTKR